MSVCTFFGHRECCLDSAVLLSAIEHLINEGVEEFLVGHQGQFDSMVCSSLRSLRERYPHIRYSVVLAYLQAQNRDEDFSDTVYPEGIETVLPKYAIDWRNRYLIDRADICLCYIDYSWGGAYKFAQLAQRRGRKVINLGKCRL